MAGARRNKYEINARFASTTEYACHLIETMLDGVKVTDYPIPVPWAPVPLQTEEEYLMGLFDDLKAAGVEFSEVDTDPFNYKPGKYIGFVTGVTEKTVKTEKNGEQRIISFTYRFATKEEGGEDYEGRYANKPLNDDKWLPNAKMFQEDATAAMNSLGFVFQRFEQLGIEEPEGDDGYGAIEMEELEAAIGTKLNITLGKTKPKDGTEGRTIVQSVSVWEPPSMADMKMADLAAGI